MTNSYISDIIQTIALANTNLPSEQELLRRLSEGDQNALTCIYQQFWQPLFLASYNVIRDKKACEDIVQEIFLQLWLKREQLQVRESLKTYLSAATRYQVFRYIRKAAGRPDLFDHLEARCVAPSTDQSLLQKDLKRQVDLIVAVLPEKCRLIYKLSREEYLSHKEIAERLDISIKTVENQLSIALRRLRHSLESLV